MLLRPLITVLAVALSGAALAQAPADPSATPRVGQRTANQQKRIDQGVASGALNEKEAARLKKREAKIAADTAAAKADGTVTKAERAKLHNEQNRASRAIGKQKHDAQKTG